MNGWVETGRQRLEFVRLVASTVTTVLIASVVIMGIASGKAHDYMDKAVGMYTAAESARAAWGAAGEKAEQEHLAAEEAREEYYKARTQAIRKGCRIKEDTDEP